MVLPSMSTFICYAKQRYPILARFLGILPTLCLSYFCRCQNEQTSVLPLESQRDVHCERTDLFTWLLDLLVLALVARAAAALHSLDLSLILGEDGCRQWDIIRRGVLLARVDRPPGEIRNRLPLVCVCLVLVDQHPGEARNRIGVGAWGIHEEEAQVCRDVRHAVGGGSYCVRRRHDEAAGVLVLDRAIADIVGDHIGKF